MDFLVVPEGVLVRVELPEGTVETSCLVGDLLGDYADSVITCPNPIPL